MDNECSMSVKLIHKCYFFQTTLKLVKDGSGQGGALVAAINEKTAS